MGPTFGLEAVAKRKILSHTAPAGNVIPIQPTACNVTSTRIELSRLQL